MTKLKTPYGCTQKRSPFTLVELVVVIIVLALAAGLAVSSFRGESPAMKLENTAAAFRDFCGSIRYRAMEDGAARAVVFDPDKLLFEMREQVIDQDGNAASVPSVPALQWKIPEGFEFTSSDFDVSRARELFSEDTGLEVFRFYADGGASGVKTFSCTYKSCSITFSISPLTGLVRIDTSDDGAERMTEK